MSLSESSSSQVACQVCLSPFNSQDHRPLLLPACGHTFCAYCVGCLYQQGKKFCPKCRKDGAVQPVSSLPVNYSLLDIAQNNSCGAADDTEPNPSSPPRGKVDTLSHPPSKVPFRRLHRVAQNNSQILNANHLISSKACSQGHLRTGAVNPPVPSDVAIMAPSTRTWGAYNPAPTHRKLKEEEQDELDFQMAVHLTFCKDDSHDHDLHNRCSSWCWQKSEDEDLNAFLTHMQ